MVNNLRKQSTFDIQEWFRILDRYAAEGPFMLDREQPPAPERAPFDDDPREDGRNVRERGKPCAKP